MAAPAYQAIGTVVTGTGDITVAWPTHAADDIALLLVQTSNEAAVLGTPAGFVEIPDSPQGTGTAATAGSTRLTVFWCRATSSSMTSPVVTDPGNHAFGVILTVRGCITTGDPWDVTAGDTGTASATITIPGDTTTVAECLIVAMVAHPGDVSSSALFSNWANASLVSITERLDFGFTDGTGGGFGAATGEKSTAGTVDATTATIISSVVQARIMIALKPPAAGGGSIVPNLHHHQRQIEAA